jgi:GGDEF domain-containing protein
MYRFRILLILTFAWLIFVFNLERPDDFIIEGNLDLSSIVYILDGLIVLVLVLFPRLTLWSLFITFPIVLLTYVLGRVLFTRPDLSDPVIPYAIITEAATVGVTFVLARKLIRWLVQFERRVFSSVLSASAEQVLDDAQAERLITDELLRARQFKRPATLLHLDLSKVSPKATGLLKQYDPNYRKEQEYWRLRVSEMVQRLIHHTDLIGWYKDDLVLCLPECTKIEAAKLAQQIHHLFSRVLETEVTIGVAEFPDDALVFEDLVRFAQKSHWRNTQEMRSLSLEEGAPA